MKPLQENGANAKKEGERLNAGEFEDFRSGQHATVKEGE